MANILVQIELSGGQPDPRSLGLINEGRAIASRLGATLYAMLPCDTPPSYDDNDIIAVLSQHGADKVILLSHADLGGELTAVQREIVVRLACDRFPPHLVLLPDDDESMELGAGLALHLEGQYIPMASPGFCKAFMDQDGNGQQGDPMPYGMRILREIDGPLVMSLEQDGPPQHMGDEEAEVVVLHPRMPGDVDQPPDEEVSLEEADTDVGVEDPRQDGPFSAEEVTADVAPPREVDPDEPTPDPGPPAVADDDPAATPQK